MIKGELSNWIPQSLTNFNFTAQKTCIQKRQKEVTAEADKLLTSTFHCLAYGVKSDPGALQQIMDTMLPGIDDIFIVII